MLRIGIYLHIIISGLCCLHRLAQDSLGFDVQVRQISGFGHSRGNKTLGPLTPRLLGLDLLGRLRRRRLHLCHLLGGNPELGEGLSIEVVLHAEQRLLIAVQPVLREQVPRVLKGVALSELGGTPLVVNLTANTLDCKPEPRARILERWHARPPVPVLEAPTVEARLCSYPVECAILRLVEFNCSCVDVEAEQKLRNFQLVVVVDGEV